MGIDWIEPLAEVQQGRQRSNNTKMFECVCVWLGGGGQVWKTRCKSKRAFLKLLKIAAQYGDNNSAVDI